MDTRTTRITKLTHFAYFSLLSLWFATLVLLYIVSPAIHGRLSFFTNGNSVNISDFARFYSSGALARSASSASVYDHRVQVEWINRLIAPAHVTDTIVTEQVPFFFFLMMPFSLLAVNLAQLLWDLFSAFVGITGLILLVDKCAQLRTKLLLGFIVGILASCPSLLCLAYGQIMWLFVGLSSLFIWAWLTKRDILAGITLALAMIKPQYTLFLAIPALVGKRYKLLLTSAASEVVLLSLAGQTIGWQNVWNYPHILSQVEASGQILAPLNMISIRCPLNVLMTQELALKLTTALYLVGAIIISCLWYHVLYRSKSPHLIPWAIAVSIVTSLVLNPHTLIYDALLLAITAAATLPTLNMFKLVNTAPISARLWYLILYTYPVMSWVLCVASPTLTMRNCLYLLLNVLLLGCGSFYISSQCSQTTLSEPNVK